MFFSEGLGECGFWGVSCTVAFGVEADVEVRSSSDTLLGTEGDLGALLVEGTSFLCRNFVSAWDFLGYVSLVAVGFKCLRGIGTIFVCETMLLNGLGGFTPVFHFSGFSFSPHIKQRRFAPP